MIKENKRIIFNGNNYTDEWQQGSREARAAQPAEHRRRAARAGQARVDQGCSRSTRCSTSASSTRATRSLLENYIKTINIEAQLMVLMANRYILPAALRVPDGGRRRAVAAVKAAGGSSARRRRSCSTELDDARSTSCKSTPTSWRTALDTPADGAPRSTPSTCATRVVPAMAALREPATRSSCTSRTTTWPLPTYREMLFIK